VKAIVVLLALALAAPAWTQSLTLEQAVDAALRAHPSIAAAESARDRAEARRIAAHAMRHPRLELSETAMRGNNPVFVFGSLLEQGAFASQHFSPAFLNAPDALTSHRAAATASITIFDGFRASAAIGQARNETDRADSALEATRQALRAEVIKSFYGVMIASERVRVAEEAVNAAAADARAARDRFEQGMLVESDALAAEVHLAALRRQEFAAESELAVSRAALATLLAHPPSDAVTPDGAMVAGDDALPLDEAIRRALANRHEIEQAALRVADAQLQVRAERGSLLPRADAFATYGASGDSFGSRNSDYTAALSLRIAIYDRSRQGQIASARAAIQEARAAEAMIRDRVTMEVIAAWHATQVARESSHVASAAIAQAEAAARIVRDRHQEGLTTITEHLRAQSALLSARFDLLAARYAAVSGRAELLRAMGELHDLEAFR
jgi:outer membrane protein TolC